MNTNEDLIHDVSTAVNKYLTNFKQQSLECTQTIQKFEKEISENQKILDDMKKLLSDTDIEKLIPKLTNQKAVNIRNTLMELSAKLGIVLSATTYECDSCHKHFPVDQFKVTEGVVRTSACKSCIHERETQRNQTDEGKLRYLYKTIKEHNRTHDIKTIYTVDDFVAWGMKDKFYLYLVKMWKKNNFSNKYMPRIKRLVDYNGYAFDNMCFRSMVSDGQIYTINIKTEKGHPFDSMGDAANVMGLTVNDVFLLCKRGGDEKSIWKKAHNKTRAKKIAIAALQTDIFVSS